MKEEFYIESLGYTVSSATELLDEGYNITPKINELLDETYDVATEGKKSGIKLIQKCIKKYPHIPNFKNHLAVLYTILGKRSQAKEVNRIIVTEHPEYLFGKLNMASNYFYAGEYKKMLELLGEELSLKNLYPARDIFQLSEVLNYLKMSVLYYCGIENLEKAEVCYGIMQEIEERFDSDDDESSQVLMNIVGLRMMNMQKMLKEEGKTKNKVIVDPEPVKQKHVAPEFNHPEMVMLYENGFEIDRQKLEQILALPRETLIEDLLKVLIDSLERYEYFQNETDEDGFSDERHSFPVHAFFLLGELEAKEVLPNILNYLKRERDFYDYWYSDMFMDNMWEPMYKLAKDKLEVLKQFMLEPGISEHAKSLVYHVVEQVILLQPERRSEGIQWYRDIFNHFLDSKIDDNIIDSDLIAFMTWSAIDINGVELLPEIEELYKRNYATLSICGDFDEVKLSFENEEKRGNVKKVLPLAERYDIILTGWYSSDEKEDGNGEQMQNAFGDIFKDNFIRKSGIEAHPKVGRNEPCPCGSGKKYKKCCLTLN